MSEKTRVKVLRENEVASRVGLSRSTRWRMVRDGLFPAPIELSERARGWLESDIDAWIASRKPAAFAGSVK